MFILEGAMEPVPALPDRPAPRLHSPSHEGQGRGRSSYLLFDNACTDIKSRHASVVKDRASELWKLFLRKVEIAPY